MIRNLFKRKKKKLNIINVFNNGETVIYYDGYDRHEVEIQGVWKDMATIKYSDGYTMNVWLESLSKK